MTTKKQYVKILVNELIDLIEAKEVLTALECGGIEDWIRYDECFDNYAGENDFDSWDEYIWDTITNIKRDYKAVE